MNQFELMPNNSRKSFGGKAVVTEDDSGYYLKSYDVYVAYYTKKREKMLITSNQDHLTTTSCIHIKAFFAFCGFNERPTKKQLKEKTYWTKK